MPISEKTAAKIGKGAYPETARALAEKWGEVWSVPSSWIVSHQWVESANHPRIVNPAGPAYGMMQIKIPTLHDVLDMLRKFKKLPRVAATLKATGHKRFSDLGERALLNPDFNVMIGSLYLKHLLTEFEDQVPDMGDSLQDTVAAAYNQGPGAMRIALREGEKTPAMRHYVARIDEAKEKGFA